MCWWIFHSICTWSWWDDVQPASHPESEFCPLYPPTPVNIQKSGLIKQRISCSHIVLPSLINPFRALMKIGVHQSTFSLPSSFVKFQLPLNIMQQSIALQNWSFCHLQLFVLWSIIDGELCHEECLFNTFSYSLELVLILLSFIDAHTVSCDGAAFNSFSAHVGAILGQKTSLLRWSQFWVVRHT